MLCVEFKYSVNTGKVKPLFQISQLHFVHTLFLESAKMSHPLGLDDIQNALYFLMTHQFCAGDLCSLATLDSNAGRISVAVVIWTTVTLLLV